MDQITEDIFNLQKLIQRIAQESYKKGELAGMENCGHDFLDNADDAYEEEKGRKAVDGIKSK